MGLLTVRGSPEIAALAARIDGWTQECLAPYREKYPTNPNSSSKTIQDLVWGPIEVRPDELYLLDSPLLQRLRYVAQLGVAQFLYPTIGYSRFEHSLGALFQVDRMLRAVSSHRGSPDELSQLPYTYCIRLAALLHDVGHCAFSHVSEKYYQFHPEITSARNRLKQLYRRRPSAAEVLSLLIISSPAVRALIRVPSLPNGERPLSDDNAVELICAAIAGSNSEEWEPFLTQFVNGGVDCDKLDYLARDAASAGTPAMLDSGRLLSKLRVTRKAVEGGEIKTLAIDVSGIRALEELLTTRVFLFDKIYFHHKLLAAEELLRRALLTAAKVEPVFEDPVYLLRYADEDFLRFRMPTPNRNEMQEAIAQAEHLFWRVANRDLPKRQFAFANRFWLKPPELIRDIAHAFTVPNDRANQAHIRDLLADPVGRIDDREALRHRIEVLSEALGHRTGIYVVWPDPERVSYKLEIPAVDADGETMEVETLFSSAMWVEAYGVNKQTGYVFADVPEAAAYLAAERAFAEKSMWWDARSWKLAKAKNTEIAALRQRFVLERASFPDWLAFRKPADFLRSKEAEPRLEGVCNKLGTFLDTRGIDTLGLIRTWLWQFPDVDLQESALRVLEQIRVVTRGDRKAAFDAFEAQTPTKVWCELTSKQKRTSSSSARIGYEAKDIGAAPEIGKLWELDVSKIREQGTVVFFDDILCSGTQAVSLLYCWFGQPDAAPSAGDRDDPLPDHLQELIREVGLTFFYPVGFQQGRDLLEKFGRDLNVRVTVFIHLDAARNTLENVEFECDDSKKRLIDFLAVTGKRLLRSKQPDWSEERVEEFSLGYGGLRAIITSDHAVPTCTLVPVWQGCYDPENLWLPILPRDQQKFDEFQEAIKENLARKFPGGGALDPAPL